jgi:D-alanyl-D-alanine carboxypeptidase/D-alanyl-D-alanine-endopeptidase (penicillin-binding protein 4)
LVFFAPAAGADDLAKKLEAVMDGPDYVQAHWGVLVVDAKSGDVVYARNPDKLFTPASTTKLFSSAAALIALGPDYKFETPVYQRGKLSKDGLLDGDLILVASGDLTFGGRMTADGKTAFKDHDHVYANSGLMESEVTDTNPVGGFDDLAKQIAKAGVKEVTGEILIDDRLFQRVKGSGSGPDAVTPMMVNDNVVDLVVTPPDVPDGKPKVELRPTSGLIQLDADVTTGLALGKPTLSIAVLSPTQFAVRGKVPYKGKPVVRIFPVEDPALFARALFIEALRRAGVRVATPLAKPVRPDLPEADSYAKMTKVAVHSSAPFKDAVTVTLKVSHNLYASALPCLVAAKNGKKTVEEGLRIQGRILKDLGVDVKTISFGGGAGGANADCVTPRAAVQLLLGMAKRPEWDAYKAALPVLGVDGTLSDVVEPDCPAKGHVFGKTGTLIWGDAMNNRMLLRSKALAGVMTTKSGTDLVFAMFVNDVPLPAGMLSTREGKTLGKLAEIIQQNGP